MRLKKLPQECIAPFRLKEITLHGIGSYYKPARLEIKPLTILCGANGSGKSTWMKVLSTVKEALEVAKDKKEKPGELDFLIRLINAFNSNHLLNENLNYQEIFTSINDDEWDSYVGPKGSFSLSYTCTRATELNTEAVKSSAKWPSVLRTQTLQKGDVIRFRFTQCAIRHDDEKKSCLLPAWRLSINGNYIEICAGQEKYNGKYKLLVRTGIESAEALTAKDSSQKTLKNSDAIVGAFSKLAGQLMQMGLEGYFQISAIRNIYPEVNEPAGVRDDRYVGANGEFSNYLCSKYGSSYVLDPRAKCSYGSSEYDGFDESFFGSDDNKIILRVLKIPAFCEWLATFYPKDVLEFKKKCEKLTDSQMPTPDKNEIINAINKCLEYGCGSFFKNNDVPVIVIKYARKLFDIIKELAFSKNFFRWVVSSVDSNKLTIDGQHPDFEILPWVRFLSTLNDSELSSSDTETLNKWAVRNCFYGLSWDEFADLSMIVDWWDHELLGISAIERVENATVRRKFLGKRVFPVGYLLPNRGQNIDDAFFLTRDSLNPYTNQLLGGHIVGSDGIVNSFKPAQFSAGLHQVTPVITQMSLMKMNEVMAVENPEVHLHPGLQLKFMGFFIENALVGKFSLIETHSDLMIRRAWRAIQEEKIPQSWVKIYFVDIEQVEGEDIWTSKIDGLVLNTQNEISNWPKGFLDDDVLESEALMRAMYGNRRMGKMEEVDHE